MKKIYPIMYRTEEYSGSRVRDIIKIMQFEIFELGNKDILDMCYIYIKFYPDMFSDVTMAKINAVAQNYFTIKDEDEQRIFCEEIIQDINRYTNRNYRYGLWLAKKRIVQNEYVVEDKSLIEKYQISDFALSNLGNHTFLFLYEDMPKPLNTILPPIHSLKKVKLDHLIYNEDKETYEFPKVNGKLAISPTVEKGPEKPIFDRNIAITIGMHTYIFTNNDGKNPLKLDQFLLSQSMKGIPDKNVLNFIYEILECSKTFDEYIDFIKSFGQVHNKEFAKILQYQFKRGGIYLHTKYNHYVWKDNNTCYDIAGVYEVNIDELEPVYTKILIE